MKNSLSTYMHIYTQRFQVNGLYCSHIPKEDLCLSIVVPSFKEPDILPTLESLKNCIPPSGTVELIVVINAPENSPKEFLQTNDLTCKQIQTWIEDDKPDFIEVIVIREEKLPIKHAGAGWARKIGMDEAAQRWAMTPYDGPILCLDADCRVSEDYLIAAEKSFADPVVNIGHFYFEHLYHLEQDPVLQDGIIQYELHLRCFINGLKTAGYPFAVHTVGSCMAVRSSTYVRSGGMNRRKAGEDFYFIHKLLPSGGWKYIPATVYPSCRISDRVPFGTGRAQTEWQKSPHTFLTYNPEIYSLLKPLFEMVTSWYSRDINLDFLSPVVRDFLIQSDIINRVNSMKGQSKNMEVFRKKFWQWMDGFKVLKLTHYLRDRGFPNQPVQEVAQLLIHDLSPKPGSLIEQFRQLDVDNGELNIEH
jgi:glycosyltransferase involved in cell wall biosynthesis